ncbi:hypothetical protein G2W53_037368 [Senna tora]|uniref:Uncharacterized protein n=1 Tax=Senna tora TaxID=362788 RepID=A0A834SUR0_9FABA|nr:hypothetical protein G2W53_037368 [Senna tora]
MSSNNHKWHSDRYVQCKSCWSNKTLICLASLSSQIGLPLTKEVKSLGIQGAVKAVSPFVQPLKVDKLILLADFIVLDYEEDKNVPIILGRPFLATGTTIIDGQKGELTMRIQDQEDDELKYHPIDPSDQVSLCWDLCDVDFVGCAKIPEAPPWKIKALPWCHKPSPSYSMEQDWIFMQGLQDNIVHERGYDVEILQSHANSLYSN